MSVAVRDAGIDVVVHGAGRELDLEVGLVLDRVAALRGIGVVILGLVVAIHVIVEGIVDDCEIIRSLERLDDLTLDVQRVRAGARRLVDDDPAIERHRSGEVDLRPEARDRSHDTAGEIGAVVDECLIDPIDAVVFAVPGVLETAGDQDAVSRRDLGEHGGKQRLLMKIHVVVIAAAVVARETHARSHVRCHRTVDIEGRAPLLLAVEFHIERLRVLREGGHLRGDVDLAAHARAGSRLDARRSLDDIDGIDAVEADRGAVSIQGEAVAHSVEEHVGVLAADARYVRLAERRVRIAARRQVGKAARILDVEGIELRLRKQRVVARRVHDAEIEPVGRRGGHRGGENQLAALDAVDDDFIEIVRRAGRRGCGGGRCRGLLSLGRLVERVHRTEHHRGNANDSYQAAPHPSYWLYFVRERPRGQRRTGAASGVMSIPRRIRPRVPWVFFVTVAVPSVNNNRRRGHPGAP